MIHPFPSYSADEQDILGACECILARSSLPVQTPNKFTQPFCTVYSSLNTEKLWIKFYLVKFYPDKF